LGYVILEMLHYATKSVIVILFWIIIKNARDRGEEWNE
jgi:hypothetical protein